MSDKKLIYDKIDQEKPREFWVVYDYLGEVGLYECEQADLNITAGEYQVHVREVVPGSIQITREELDFIRDVGEIAKFALWQSDVDLKKAQEVIDKYHGDGRAGIWVQWSKLIEKL